MTKLYLRHSLILQRLLPLLFCSVGILFFVWAFADSRFRDVEGFLEGSFCLPATFGLALIILGWAGARRWTIATFWLVLALVGQAVALQLIEAGPVIRYQHYKPVSHLLTDTNVLLLLYLVIQTSLVTIACARRWLHFRSWIGYTFRPWQLLGIGLVFFLSSATVSRDIPIYVTELFFAAFIQAVNLANIILAAWTAPKELVCWIQRQLEKGLLPSETRSAKDVGGVDRFALCGAFWVIGVATVLSIFAYERHPHIPDEVAYLYHARYFANGVLTMPAPPIPEAFDFYLMHFEKGQWFPSPPPGWPALLALGVLLNIPWLVNPMLAGLNVLLVYIMLQQLYSRRIARLAVFLLCVSPWHLFMAMNFMVHTFTLTCALIATVSIMQARKTGRLRWAWTGGLATGIVSLVRPLNGLIVASLLGLWSLGVGGSRLKLPAVAAFVIGVIVAGSAIFPYNKRLTGSATVFPIMAYTDKHFGPKSNALGFGPERGMGWAIDPFPGHGPIDALVNANLNAFSLNIELFGWSTGSLILIALMVFSGALQSRDYLMLAVIAAIFAAYFFYYFSGGPDFGARYWFLMLAPCVTLTARGILLLEQKLSGTVGASRDEGRVMVAVLALAAFTLVNYLPWRAIDKYHHYRGMRPDIRSLAQIHRFDKSLVLVRGALDPDYASASAYNPVDLQADAPVYAWDRSPEIRTRLLQAYADRPIWIVNGPTITRRGFEVAAGPLSAHELEARVTTRETAALDKAPPLHP